MESIEESKNNKIVSKKDPKFGFTDFYWCKERQAKPQTTNLILTLLMALKIFSEVNFNPC